MESAFWGLIGTLVGALTSIGTTWLSHRHAHVLQAEKVNVERTQRAKSFQRDTLLDLQEAIHDLLRLNARAHFEELSSFRQTGKWGQNLLTEEVDEGLQLSNRRVAILVERVAEENLRSKVKAFTKIVTQGMFVSGEHESELNQRQLMHETVHLFEYLGNVLRNNYD